MKIRHQLLLTHGLLVALAVLIVLINTLTYIDMESDAAIINQSGRLRALSYNMVQLSNRICSDYTYNNTDLKRNLRQRMEEFESILVELGDPQNAKGKNFNHFKSIEKLRNIDREWHKNFNPLYGSILADELTQESCKLINRHIDSYVDEINEMVTAYSIYAKEKVINALVINGGLLMLIIIVAGYSFISTESRIRRPMIALSQELMELSFIDDSKRLGKGNRNEILEMKEHFNIMIYDQLTETYNRRSGLAKLGKILRTGGRRHLRISLCFVDINGLKDVNDQLGHKYGDELIISAVNGIKQEIREEDFIIRMGGDEFLIVLKGIGQEQAEMVWERIAQRYLTINEREDRPYSISVSHGISEYDSENPEGPDMDFLITEADNKMYAEKKYLKEVLKVQIIKSPK